jgi:methionine sulfoxide reductase catalytic subunit
MPNILLPPGWAGPGRPITPEHAYWNRRRFLKSAGGALAVAGAWGCGPRGGGGQDDPSVPSERPSGPLDTIPETPSADLYPATRSDTWQVPERPLTDRLTAATHNNFYEFTTEKGRVWEHVGPFEARPWTLEVTGEVDTPGVFDVADLERSLGLEERIYRFRCVEAWSMTVPWVGFPLHRLLARVQPLSSARYVRFVSFNRPEQAVGQRTQTWYPWPYYEGLRMDEAMHELTMGVTGIFGAPLPKQHGAPFRIVVPWKYGYKSPKSVVRIEVLRERPPIFWEDLQPTEYPFYSNVNPKVPHPRWSQAREMHIGENVERDTLLLNGYAREVAHLYSQEVLNTLS